jgi:DNA-binding transcriptional MerR regulator/methylmalonyl-CoA mutase cobalamin-binding subunit
MVDSIYTIATISLETGIAKEVLRKWEARYGFPIPERDSGGHRVYTAQQIARLKLIKKLIDAGMRPGQVVLLEDAKLLALAGRSQESVPALPQPQVLAPLMRVFQSRDAYRLREELKAEINRLGLESFVVDVMPALTTSVGEAWERGEASVSDEHMYTEIMQGLIREELARIVKPDGQPRVLVTTPSGELHTLGILMVEAVVSIYGGFCLSLGAQTPVDEIVSAIRQHRIEIAGLSFSASFPKRKIAPVLKELRGLVPKEIELWAGGTGTTALDRKPHGVRVIPTLQGVVEAMQKFKKRN